MDGLSVTINPDARVAILTWTDVQPELEAWRDAFERLLHDPAFAPDFGIVSDRRLTTRSPSVEFVRGFVNTVAAHVASGRFLGRWATVVAPDQLAVFGMGRMTEILTEHQRLRYRVFTDFDEALTWVTQPAANGRRAGP